MASPQAEHPVPRIDGTGEGNNGPDPAHMFDRDFDYPYSIFYGVLHVTTHSRKADTQFDGAIDQLSY